MMISLVNTGAVLNWELPADVPLWAAALILLVAYQIVVSPIRAAQQWPWHPRAQVQPGQYVFWNAVVWLIGMAFVVWLPRITFQRFESSCRSSRSSSGSSLMRYGISSNNGQVLDQL